MNKKSIFTRWKFGRTKLPNFKTGVLIASAMAMLHTLDADAQGRLVINDAVINLHGGTASSPIILVVDNQADNAVSPSGDGRINSEGQFNILQWNIKNGTGEYAIPFDLGGAAVLSGIAINTAGSSEGFIRYSSYGTGTDNMPLPQGVTTLDHANDPNNLIPSDGAKVYNRYWFIDAQYDTKPAGEISLRYTASEMDGDLDFRLDSQWFCQLPSSFHDAFQALEIVVVAYIGDVGLHVCFVCVRNLVPSNTWRNHRLLGIRVFRPSDRVDENRCDVYRVGNGVYQ